MGVGSGKHCVVGMGSWMSSWGGGRYHPGGKYSRNSPTPVKFTPDNLPTHSKKPIHPLKRKNRQYENITFAHMTKW